MRRPWVLIFLVLVSCAGYSRHGAQSTIPPSSVSYGSGAVKLPTAGARPSPGTAGTLRVHVLDNARRALPGATLAYKGPARGTMTTDARGVAQALVPIGDYQIEIRPCGSTVVTDTYREASARVTANARAAEGTLDGVKWHRRFRPSPSVEMSRRPPWRIGSDVTLGVLIEDGCSFKPAAGAPIHAYRWTVSSNYRISRTPVLRADGMGYAQITVRCTARGDGSIVIYDRQNTSDRVDLLEAASAPSGHHWCE
jgi:hypothetical protein